MSIEEDDENIELLILGIGNILLGDEGVGVHIVRKLEKLSFPSGVECLDGGTGAFALLNPMMSAKKVILIDAALNNDKPGSLTRLSPKFATDYPVSLSGHEVGLRDLINSFYLLGKKTPNVILYAISIEPPTGGFHLELSKEVEAVIPKAISRIKEEVENYFKQ